MDKSKLSKTAKIIEEKRIGYRYEEISTGIYPLHESLLFEIEELGNTDVFDTLQNLYNIKTTNIDEILYMIYKYFNTNEVYGLWVSTNQGVVKTYIEPFGGFDAGIYLTKYKLPSKRLILSDIDEQGIWYAIKEHPDTLIFGEVMV